jgi:hypothetical protein
MEKLGEHSVYADDIDRVSPSTGDIHAVANALADRPLGVDSCLRCEYWYIASPCLWLGDGGQDDFRVWLR